MFLFGESYDNFPTSELGKRWPQFNGSISAGNGRNGTSEWRHLFGTCSRNIPNTDKVIVGAAYKWQSAADDVLLSVRDSTVTQLAVYLTSPGELQLKRGNTTIATTSAANLTTATWHFIELKATIHPTTGSYELRVNGETLLSAINTNTRNSANSWVNAIWVHTMASNGELDDVYVCDGSGAVNNDFLGDCRMIWKGVNGAGDNAEWAPSAGANHQCVDDPLANQDTDYTATLTPGARDDFTLAPTGITGTVHAVQIEVEARKDDAAARAIKLYCVIAGVRYYSPDIYLSDSYAYYFHVWELNPATSAPWTVAAVDAAKFGYELVS